jgi:CheY-like chemotaxis protein
VLAVLDAHGPFDVIVSDIGMSETDRYMFMRSVRAREGLLTCRR